jgi:pectin methylesterase-like acyl-CoA thioesterase
MDHEGVEPHMVISEIIEDLAQAEGRLQAARDKMNVPFLADGLDYASIVAHIDSALASAGAAISEAHSKLHEP